MKYESNYDEIMKIGNRVSLLTGEIGILIKPRNFANEPPFRIKLENGNEVAVWGNEIFEFNLLARIIL